MIILADLIYVLILLVVGPYFLLRPLFGGRRVAGLRLRLGACPKIPGEGPLIWLHGVSVGEILAARSLVQQFQNQNQAQACRVALSVTTLAGFEVAQREYPDLKVFYCPLDFSWAVRRVLRRLKPDVLVLMELELWPNLLHLCQRRDIPIVVVNAKMSANSCRGYGRLMKIFPNFMAPITTFCVQNELYSERIHALGVPMDRIHMTGSLKVDNLPAVPRIALGQSWRRFLGFGSEPLILAGSTHEGEEEAILAAFVKLREKWPHVRLLIVPRHLERLDQVRDLAQKKGLQPTLRSEFGAFDADRPGKEQKASSDGLGPELILVDTMGELAKLFALADFVFLGGSLAKVGGHNVLEPAAEGKPLILGPHTWTVTEFVKELETKGAAVIVQNEQELELALERFLGDEKLSLAAGRAARDVVDRHDGAAERSFDLVLDCLSQSQTMTDLGA